MHDRNTVSKLSPYRFNILLSALLALLLMSGSAGCSEQDQSTGNKQTSNQQSQATETVQESTSTINLVTAIEQVARNTIPAVVHIEVTERKEVPHSMLPFLNDPFFRRFFGAPGPPQKFEREIKGIGTGMIMDPKGNILTNYHVAGGATKIVVQLADGRIFQGKLVGGDPKTDLAVVHIDADGNLPQVVFGDSDKVEVGQWVVAIGEPRGFNQTVTQGIISAKHRTGITNPSDYQDFLQTDAAINPGNSGGPLLTLEGKVIGINSVIATTSGGFQGIGFAIPSKMALYVADQILKYGKVKRGWLGVSVQNVTEELAKAFKLKQIRGALVAGVMKDSPAAAAGLQKGDVITAYQGNEIIDAAGLRNDVATTPIGEKVTLTLIRDGKKKEVTVKIGSLEKAEQMMTSSVEQRLGADFEKIPAEVAKRFDIEQGQGLEITRIGQGPLAQAGFEKGDLILAINNRPITSLEAFAALIRQVPTGQTVALLAVDHRTGQSGYVQVTLP
ncbi:MAG: DegQ family serine endoprotease [Deltaproteobacteria bacterium]|jgi:serine protease Do